MPGRDENQLRKLLRFRTFKENRSAMKLLIAQSGLDEAQNFHANAVRRLNEVSNWKSRTDGLGELEKSHYVSALMIEAETLVIAQEAQKAVVAARHWAIAACQEHQSAHAEAKVTADCLEQRHKAIMEAREREQSDAENDVRIALKHHESH